MKIFKTILIGIIILLSLIFILIVYIDVKIQKMDYVKLEEKVISLSENDYIQDYINIALLGIDTRIDKKQTKQSDCIMIISINPMNKQIKLVSVYRDTCLEVNGRVEKINYAYALGGGNLIVKSLNENMDLNVSEFIVVDFKALINFIDTIGGIDVDIKSEEVKYINFNLIDLKYMNDNEFESIMLNKKGTQTLNGLQVLAYCRVRTIGNGDFDRTQRMQNVFKSIIDKLKTKNIFELNDVIDNILPQIQTSFTTLDLVKLFPEILQYKKYDIVKSLGWPYSMNAFVKDENIYPIYLEDNVLKLHKELFNDDNYVVPERIKNIGEFLLK